MQILKLAETTEDNSITQACAVLSQGGLLIFPTETTYGAGVDATQPAAVQKLLSYKSRREGKPLSIAVADAAVAEKYALVNEQARTLYKQFLPGPLTIVSYAREGTLAPGVASEFGTIGVRIPDYPFMLKLLRAYGKPITATSANASGEKRPYSLADIFAALSPKQLSLIDCCLDAGTLPERPPSTVIDTTLATPVTLRQGELLQHDAQTVATVLITTSERETKDLAGKLVLKKWDQIKQTGLLIGLNGPLGAGKTVFSKGVAEFLQIPDVLHSPTYSYYEEYPFTRHGVAGTLIHADFWKVDSRELFHKLEFEKLLKPNHVIVVEWWSQVAEFAVPLLTAASIPSLIGTFEDTNSARNITIYET